MRHRPREQCAAAASRTAKDDEDDIDNTLSRRGRIGLVERSLYNIRLALTSAAPESTSRISNSRLADT